MTTDWNAVLKVLDKRFPAELEIAMLTVRAEQAEAALEAAEPAQDQE